jgi:hypothetical protein
MAGFNIDLKQFNCSVDDFAQQMVNAGIAGAGTGRYYLMPAALPVLEKAATERRYPFCEPATARKHTYSGDSCPNAQEFLESFIRWSTFNERYQPEHCEMVAQIVRDIADRNRK